ncbi:MAG: ATP-dependent zinc metalloprotease FtsH [Peptoniphilus harei]|uniref:ATP-dependent zinc metalloprotease FtsH n=2 Tax=Peptoniphilus TaxID=162289 RepID=E4L0U1_9FIRM|nr:ATP-dependent zinc metalloprotease FtsH [Peptoniphilus harei]EFR32285.1 cell division protease FtsH [Peptoniphilus harei ACS-146-V-Sch2b]MDK7755676.1 ATP-dependent zinc metalloprotease FtsH [Peptoniphilus harei]MDK7761268.1 ATP-dependent zinc metalloprotease FtsH [Peptoniphilus harei]MDK8271358.1 ATP-dependent zinc metalloprotease FtsH [Peptoniphilus harei]MDK8339879.1 ATP-dependent zinc metalloprotease FtsH [Peptoniphilus harei]
MNKKFGGAGFYIVLILVLILSIRFFGPPANVVEEKSFTEFVTELEKDNVKSVNLQNGIDSIASVKLKNGDTFRTVIPQEAADTFYKDYLKEKSDAGTINVVSSPTKQTSFLVEWIPTLLMFAFIVFFWYKMMQQAGGGGKMNSFGKSKAKLINKEDGKNLVKFKDVAGLEEEKEELAEIVDFLKDPKKFINMGARIPKGVLLVGPPGTGKTYLSKAVAGEAGVPFFIMSGSDFVEMFVGVGASRVRDLFESAKKNAPCIIFIDEIDAVGRKRGAGLGGGHDEREQTLNQLLVEMDGFGTNEGVIVMAATNRADILDPAILRPGRFDRTVYVGKPDVRARKAILEIHSRGKKLADDVNLEVIAKRTPGFTPADLENLMNESALLAARRGENAISMEDVDEASIKVQAGPAKKSRVVSEKERKLTAVHESGHAIVSRLLPEEDPVHMITIIPRGMAGGFTAYLPEDDVSFMTKKKMEASIVSLLGGRVAESLVLDDISTGASNDIERATKIARSMVTHYGMSEKLGTINYDSSENEVFIGRDLGRSRDYSERTAAEIDDEVTRIINEAYTKCKELLSDNLDKLLALSDALLEKETIYSKDFEKIFNGEKLDEESIDLEDTINEEDLSDEAKELIHKNDKLDETDKKNSEDDKSL